MIAIRAITTTHDNDADATADFDAMNDALRSRAAAHFGGHVTLADDDNEMNLLVAGNGYRDGTADLADIYESIICDEGFYDLVNGMTEDSIRGLADEALAAEGFEAYFPGIDPTSMPSYSGVLADYLVSHPEDWDNFDDTGWSFDGDTADLVAFAIERGAEPAATKVLIEDPTQAEMATARTWTKVDHGLDGDEFFLDIHRNDDGTAAYFETPEDRWGVAGIPAEVDAEIAAALAAYQD